MTLEVRERDCGRRGGKRDGDKHSYQRPSAPGLCDAHASARALQHSSFSWSSHTLHLRTRARPTIQSRVIHRHRPWPTRENPLLTRASGLEYRTAVMTTCILRCVCGGQVVRDGMRESLLIMGIQSSWRVPLSVLKTTT